MLEYVYKINLPPLEDVVLPGIVDKLFKPTDTAIYTMYKAEEIIKPEFLYIKGIEWTAGAVHFHKTNGQIGTVHCDHHDPKNILMVAINWVYNGQGKMDYWEFDELPEPIISPDRWQNDRFCWDQSMALPPPYGNGTVSKRSYNMPRGAYLVNASMPHFPIGYENRHLISLRGNALVRKSWEYVVDLFQDLIIKE